MIKLLLWIFPVFIALSSLQEASKLPSSAGVPTDRNQEQQLNMHQSEDSIIHSVWMGFKRTDFTLNGRSCLIVEPKKRIQGNPWIWRTEFFPSSAGVPTDRNQEQQLNMHQSEDSIIHSVWMGFKRTDFTLNGTSCLIVEPKKRMKGNPWIWRTEFFGHEPQGDSTLLAKGFCVVYIDLQDMYGAPVSLDLMDGYYSYLTTTKHLNRKAVLEGFSRGGLFVFNWAARHPEMVSSIYVDAPVCDFKSWPGGKGKGDGSAGDWEKLKKVYGFADDTAAMAWQLNPIDNLKPLAEANISILCVCGEVDTVVPVDENINIVEQRYLEMGGEIKIIRKPGVGHHPHSLKDPEPIVDFVLTHFK